MSAGLIIFSLVGNSLVMYNLMLSKDSLGKKRSKTLFLNLALADVMVTLFPMAGEERDNALTRIVQEYRLLPQEIFIQGIRLTY